MHYFFVHPEGLSGFVAYRLADYLPIHIIFETLEAVTILKIWRVIPSEPSELPSLRRVYSAIATTALTQLLARTHVASIEHAALRLFGRKPAGQIIYVQDYQLRLSVVDRVTTLTVFSQQPVLFHRDGGQQTFGVLKELSFANGGH